MRRNLLILAFPLLLLIASCASGPRSGGSGSPFSGAEISDVVSQVKAALSDVQTDLADSNLPPLKQVKLSLKTTLGKKVGASFKLLVITIGGSWEEEKVQQLDLVLVPPSAGNPKQIATESVTQALKDAILSAAIGVRDASSGSIPLKLSNLDVTLGLTVKEGGEAGAKPEILPITLNLSGGLSKAQIHTLVVSFGAGK